MGRAAGLFALMCIAGALAGCGPRLPEFPLARLTVAVVDDDGNPVPGARVGVVGTELPARGMTDAAGRFVATLHNPDSQVELQADKKGYYGVNRQFYLFTGATNGQWFPWNPLLELRVHKIGAPVPMFVKEVQSDLPVLNQPIGFDLAIGDWVQPHGRGLTNDFIFEGSRRLVDDMEYSGTLTLTFPSPSDGLILMSLPGRDDFELRLAAMAPSEGYINHRTFELGSRKSPETGYRDEHRSFSEADNYYFRVRSRTNGQGTVTSAWYGKIYRGIHYVVGNLSTNANTHVNAGVRFQYFLNPDGTRNTEFDTRSNLCADPGAAGGRP